MHVVSANDYFCQFLKNLAMIYHIALHSLAHERSNGLEDCVTCDVLLSYTYLCHRAIVKVPPSDVTANLFAVPEP